MTDPSHPRITVLTVDAGPHCGESARFYTLMIGGRGSAMPAMPEPHAGSSTAGSSTAGSSAAGSSAAGSSTVREQLLVPEGDELRVTHRHEPRPQIPARPHRLGEAA